MPYTISEVRKRPRRLKRNSLYLDFVITVWPAVAHLIEESGIITDEQRKNDLYQMNGTIVSQKESWDIANYLLQLLQKDVREYFVLPNEKATLHCKPFTDLAGPRPLLYQANRKWVEKFMVFCQQVENGFKIE